MLKSGEQTNPDGAGIAWIDRGQVRYRKGLKLKQIAKLCKKLPLPYIVHFRITSVGKTTPGLCHPFPISPTANTNTSGSAKSVLFHNGTWDQWESNLLEYILDTKQIPTGDLSDSRVMAMLASQYGPKYLAKKVTGWNKIAILTPKGIKKLGAGWVNVDKVHCSNDYFQPAQKSAWMEPAWPALWEFRKKDDEKANFNEDLWQAGYSTHELEPIIETLEYYKQELTVENTLLYYGEPAGYRDL